MCGAVLNALNYRLDAGTIRFTLEHAGSKVLITDREFSDVVRAALAGRRRREEYPVAVLAQPAHEIGRQLVGKMLADFETDCIPRRKLISRRSQIELVNRAKISNLLNARSSLDSDYFVAMVVEDCAIVSEATAYVPHEFVLWKEVQHGEG